MGCQHYVLSVLVATAHTAGNPIEFCPDLCLLFPPVPCVDNCASVLWEHVPLSVIELEEAGAEDDCKEHVEDITCFDGLVGKCSKVCSILEVHLQELETSLGVPWLSHVVPIYLNFPLVAVTK